MRKLRAERAELFRSLQAVSLWAAAGLDLGFAWKQADGRTLAEAAVYYLAPSHRLWLESLLALHRSGAPTGQALERMLSQLARETESDYQAHCRTLPTRLNIAMLLLFFPPTMLLFLLPLLLQLLQEN